MFSNIGKKYKSHVWLSKRDTLRVKNKDLVHSNVKSQSQIAGQLHSCKSINIITDPVKAVNYPI